MTFTKKTIAIVTAMTLWGSIAAPALGATVADLQAQIDALMATIASLQTELTIMQGGTTPTVSGCSITSFDRALKLGMSGDDVKCLQIVLNSDADTQLADDGVGSPGNETSYLGPLTKAGVIKFQEKYASEILASYGLTAGTGYVGSTTRAKLNSLLAGGAGEEPGEPGEPGAPTAAGITVALNASTPLSASMPVNIDNLLFTLVVVILSEAEG